MHVQSNGGWLGGWLAGAGRPAGRTPPPPSPPPWLAQLQYRDDDARGSEVSSSSPYPCHLTRNFVFSLAMLFFAGMGVACVYLGCICVPTHQGELGFVQQNVTMPDF